MRGGGPRLSIGRLSLMRYMSGFNSSWFGVALAAAVAVACSSETSETTTTASGPGGSGGSGAAGGSGGAAGTADLSCLGSVPPPTFTQGTADITVRTRGFLSNAPLPGITIKVCRYSDPSCTPVLEEGVTDQEGALLLSVTTAERLYVDATSAGTFPLLGFRNGPFDSDYTLLVPTPTEAMATASLVAASIDPARGHFFLGIEDCASNPVAGAVIEVTPSDPQTRVFYVNEGQLPDSSLMETTPIGIAGALNVPVGDITIEARMAASGTVISTRTAFVRAGTLNQGPFVSPEPLARQR